MPVGKGRLRRALRVISDPLSIALPVGTVGSFREFAQPEGLRQWPANERRWLPQLEVAITQAWAAHGDAEARGTGTYKTPTFRACRWARPAARGGVSASFAARPVLTTASKRSMFAAYSCANNP